MQFSTTLLATFAALVLAAPSNPKVLTFPVTKHHRDSKFAQSHLQTRQTPVTITNNQAYYSIALTLGTPAQNFNVLLDTGSSDLWVYNVTDTVDCAKNNCEFTGQFNSELSSSYTFLNDDYYIRYVSGAATGNWGTETLGVGSITLENFQFACASSAGGDTGVLGVSVQGSESLQEGQNPYNNFPIALQNAGYIDRQVYSLYLDTISSTSGTFLLGGIDYAKFSGQLTVLDLSSSNSLSVDYDSIVYNGQTYGSADSATLDSGTSFTYIPDDAFQALYQDLQLGALNTDYGLNEISCDSDVSISFNFAGVTIVAPSSELVINTGKGCVFGIQTNQQSSGYNLFGDTFLRNAYVVYDLQDSQIGIAQAVYTSATNIQAVNGPLANN